MTKSDELLRKTLALWMVGLTILYVYGKNRKTRRRARA